MRVLVFAVVTMLFLGILGGCTQTPASEPVLPPPSKEVAPVGNGKTAPVNSVPAQDFRDGKG
jgi:hypothetical protein